MNKRTLPKGIYLRGGRFVAQARVNKKQIQLGTFLTLEAAVEALDKAIARAMQGLDSVVREDRYIERLKTYKEKTTPHADDDLPIELFHLYIIVKSATPYPQWQRNASLPALVSLDLAKRFLAKRGIEVVSMEDFKTLYRKRLDVLTEPWLKDYRIVGQGSKRNTFEVACKGCGKLSLIRIGDPPVVCECGTSETILYFGKGSDGTVYLSIGPTRPDNLLGCLYVPRGGIMPLPVGKGFEMALDPAPAADVDRILETPYVNSKRDFLDDTEDESPDEDDLDAYTKLLESKMFDLDTEFDFDSPSGADEVSKRLLAEDLAEISKDSASDLVRKVKK